LEDLLSGRHCQVTEDKAAGDKYTPGDTHSVGLRNVGGEFMHWSSTFKLWFSKFVCLRFEKKMTSFANKNSIKFSKV
jgi:hypothetical protein